MADTNEPRSEPSSQATPKQSGATPPAAEIRSPAHRRRKPLVFAGVAVGLAFVAWFLVPWVITALNTVSTDDAYVDGHVTLVAPRVYGQVTEVLVDDNYRVKKGDVLVRLDREPYQVQVAIKKAAVEVAQANLTAAQAEASGDVAQTRSNVFKMQHSIEDVKNQIANLAAAVATLNARKADLELAQANLKRGQQELPSNAISKQDVDVLNRSVKASQAGVEQALAQIYAIRAGLGLAERPPEGRPLTDVPTDLDQNFSRVRQALADTLQSAALLGYFPTSWNSTPDQARENFYKQSKGDLDVIMANLVRKAPVVKQAQAKLLQAQADLDNALLNLRYCDIVSEIDGVVTTRTVNPGNNVSVGQSLMAVRSLTQIWINGNFKETQLSYLRIGQRVRCEVDMYGSHKEFEARITGFTMGTGETLALLPPQNATGNFVKIVQRLPVRIELTDYNPDKIPLFVGLSVTPYVYYKEPATGPHAGDVLQPLYPLPQAPTDPKP
jgi:membrane fusion protein (multidrug efflux system)